MRKGRMGMIELTQLNGTLFTLNSDLIETIENIPETKVLLTNGKYFLVCEKREEIVRKVVDYRRRIYKDLVAAREPDTARETKSSGRESASVKPAVKRITPGKHGARTEQG